jgi:ABC-type sugar transport system ATPase subunit
MTRVRLEHIGKRFGKTVALQGVDLEIEAGELFFLLGPSGCGKSTLLRLIAGLQEPSEGRIWFNDEDVTRLPTQRRNAVMCFQSYALWPHMTVKGNIRFGLQVRGVGGEEQARRLEEVLRLVQMEELG